MPFVKGQSGNAGGRPKKVGEVTDLARTHTTEAIESLVYWMQQRDNPPASVAATNALLDRGYGKAAQVNLNDEGAEKLEDFLMGLSRSGHDK